MSAKQALVGLGFAVAFGAGTAHAMERTTELDRQAAQIEDCLQDKRPVTEKPEMCQAGHSSREVNVLKEQARTYGALGWFGVLGAVGSCWFVIEIFDRADPTKKQSKTTHHYYHYVNEAGGPPQKPDGHAPSIIDNPDLSPAGSDALIPSIEDRIEVTG